MITRIRGNLILLLAGLALAAAHPAGAHAQAPAPPVVVPAPGGDVSVVADRMEQVGDLLIATGNVEITRGAARLTADRVEINRTTGDAVAQGRVVFYDGENHLTGQRIEYNYRTGTGVVHQAEARTAPYYRLSGERMERLGESVYRVQRGTFTTCEDDPPLWSFRFGSATADLEDFVYGTNASFWVKNVPLIPFFPFFAAAIRRERQTGLLFPKFGTSSNKGIYAEVPFYWAINDSQDLTFAPLGYERRGPGFNAEYRYVLSTEHAGRTSGFVVHEMQRDDDTRAVGSLRHDWTIAPGLTLKADVNGVSDDEVLREYGDPIQQRSSQRVESNVFLTRTWESWNFVGNLFSYQDLTTRRPVELHRLPDLNLLGVRQPVPGVPGLLYEADARFVHFVRDVGSDGSRLDVHPRLSRPIAPGGLFTVTPFVGGRLTAYDRTVVGTRRTTGVALPVEVTEDEVRLRRLVEAGSDAELTLSRAYRAGGTWGIDGLLHTIEPRATYTWIAGSGQRRLPRWTAGVDAIDDTSRFEYSLTNRVRARSVSPPGTEPVRWEALRLVLGHTVDVARSEPGDVTGTLILQPTSLLRLRSDAAYGVERGGVQSSSNDVAVVLPFASASVGHRYSDIGNIRFFTGALTTELTRWVGLRANTYYDARADVFVESRVAVDLRFQCWALTVEYVSRQRQDDELRFAVNLLGVGGPIRTAVGLGALDTAGAR